MESIAVSGLWRLFTWLPKLVLRRVFSPNVLRDLMLVDVVPRGDQACVDLGSVAYWELWVQLINLTPFEVEVDRVAVRFWCGGTEHKDSILKRTKMASGEIQRLRVNGSMPDGHAAQIAKNIDNHQASADLHIECKCKLHEFDKSTGRLQEVHMRVLNRNHHKGKVESQ